MLRTLRFGLPILWAASMLLGIHGSIGTFLLLASVAAWAAPLFRPSQRATGSVPRTSDPRASTFDSQTTDNPAWTHIEVRPARGKGPGASILTLFALVGGAFGGGLIASWFGRDGAAPVFIVAAPLLAFGLNWLIHRFVVEPLHLSGYRVATAAPNGFDVGPAGLRIGGEVLPRPRLLQFKARNVVSHTTQTMPMTSLVAGGTGVVGTAALLGASVGSGVVQAAALQRAQLAERMAAHAWVLEVLDLQGNAHRLAGGLTQNTLDALLHIIQQRLGD